MFVVLVEEKN